MAGGWLKGLGNAFQGAAGGVEMYAKLKQQAIENALRERAQKESEAERQDVKSWRDAQLKEQQEEGDTKDLLAVWQNIPAGTKVNKADYPEHLQSILNSITREQKAPMETPPIPSGGIDSATTKGVVPGLELPTGDTEFVPSETAAARASYERQRLSYQQAMDKIKATAEERAKLMREQERLKQNYRMAVEARVDQRQLKAIEASYNNNELRLMRMDESLQLGQANLYERQRSGNINESRLTGDLMFDPDSYTPATTPPARSPLPTRPMQATGTSTKPPRQRIVHPDGTIEYK